MRPALRYPKRLFGFFVDTPMNLVVTRQLLPLVICMTLTACSLGQTVIGPSGPDEKVSAEAFNALQITDVLLPPGAKLDTESSLIIGSADRWFGRVVLKTDSPTVQTYNHFYNGMPSFGWNLITALQAKTSILSFQRGERIALIQIETASLGSTVVTINISIRQPVPQASEPLKRR